MNTALIERTWQVLGDRRGHFVDAFYERFFERFPGYRKLFPRRLQPVDLEKMLFTAALLADLADDRTDIAPRVHKLGAAHRPFGLEARDFGNFKAVFLEVLGPQVGAEWTSAAEQAWGEAFDEVIIPLMREGMAQAA